MAFPPPPLLANWKCIYSSELAPAPSFPSLPIKKIGCERLTLSVHLGVKWFENESSSLPRVCVGLIKWQNVFEVPKFDFCTCAGVSPRGALLGQSGPRCFMMSVHFNRANLVYNCLSVFFPLHCWYWFKWGEWGEITDITVWPCVSYNIGHFSW